MGMGRPRRRTAATCWQRRQRLRQIRQKGSSHGLCFRSVLYFLETFHRAFWQIPNALFVSAFANEPDIIIAFHLLNAFLSLQADAKLAKAEARERRKEKMPKHLKKKAIKTGNKSNKH